jgi:hypothetical protein
VATPPRSSRNLQIKVFTTGQMQTSKGWGTDADRQELGDRCRQARAGGQMQTSKGWRTDADKQELGDRCMQARAGGQMQTSKGWGTDADKQGLGDRCRQARAGGQMRWYTDGAKTWEILYINIQTVESVQAEI